METGTESGTCRQCGGGYTAKRRRIRADGTFYYSGYCGPCSASGTLRYRLANPEKKLWSSAKNRSNQLGLEFSLSLEDIAIPERCPVLDIPLFFSEGKRTDNTPSIDRIRPALGYVKGNITVISWRANRLKSDASIWELKELAFYYENLLRNQL